MAKYLKDGYIRLGKTKMNKSSGYDYDICFCRKCMNDYVDGGNVSVRLVSVGKYYGLILPEYVCRHKDKYEILGLYNLTVVVGV